VAGFRRIEPSKHKARGNAGSKKGQSTIPDKEGRPTRVDRLVKVFACAVPPIVRQQVRRFEANLNQQKNRPSPEIGFDLSIIAD
jgi:hypothetical protein